MPSEAGDAPEVVIQDGGKSPQKEEVKNNDTAPLATSEINDESTTTKVEIKMSDDTKNGQEVEAEFRALTKAELMKYATDPFWVWLRWGLFILFWLVWLAMLVGAVVIIIQAPKCPTPAPKAWWQKGPIYEVYVKSFKDSNGDGIGDIKGIQEKLDYFESLGVGALWLTPIYSSPMKDNGYDIKDYKNIDPMFGSLEDFKSLVASMKDRSLKLIMDFVPNHSSEEHEWFKRSVAKEDPYTDYYIWKKNTGNGPPNNWKSVFGGSAWTLHPERDEYYLHQFGPEQPDLNLRNEAVVANLKEIMAFWLDLGVDGFRIDAAGHFFEDPNFEDEPKKSDATGDSYDDFDHKFTFNQPENVGLLKEFRELLDNKTAEDSYNPRIIMSEAHLKLDEMIKYYGDVREVDPETDDLSDRSTISQMPLNFDLVSNLKKPEDVSAVKMKDLIKNYLDGLPVGVWPNFQLGNHDVSRISSRVGHDLVDAMNMIYMLLPATPVTYYGEEIGMSDATMESPADNRDPERSPMQWSAEANAGFTTAQVTPWLPINSNYETVNVASQLKQTDLAYTLNSHAAVYSFLANMRQSEAILFGSIEFFSGTPEEENVFAYTRVKKGNPGTLIIVNFGNEEVVADLSAMKNLPERGTIQVRSVYKEESHVDEGKTVLFKELKVGPKEGLVVAFVPRL